MRRRAGRSAGLALAVMAAVAAAAAEPEAFEPVNLIENGDLARWKKVGTPPPGLALADGLVPDFGRAGVGGEGTGADAPARVERDGQVRREGPYSLKFTNPTAENIAALNCFYLPVAEGRRCRFTCWVKGEGVEPAGGSGIYVRFVTGPMANFWDGKTGPVFTPDWRGDFDWRLVELEWTPRAGDDAGLVAVQLRRAAGTLWLADLKAVELDE